jgi:hypothetical protein
MPIVVEDVNRNSEFVRHLLLQAINIVLRTALVLVVRAIPAWAAKMAIAAVSITIVDGLRPIAGKDARTSLERVTRKYFR